MRRRGALVLVSPYHLISHSASAAPSPLTCRGHLALPQREAHPGLLPPGVLTSILRTASSMAADVAAISLSTIAPSSSSRTSRLLGFSSWGTRHPGVRQGGWILPWLPHRAWGPDGQCSFPNLCPAVAGPALEPLLSPSWKEIWRNGTPAPPPSSWPTLCCPPHLAQLEDALQWGPHQARPGLQQGLLFLQLPHELQRPGPTLPASVDQAWGGKRAVRGEPWTTLARPDARTSLQPPPSQVHKDHM